MIATTTEPDAQKRRTINETPIDKQPIKNIAVVLDEGSSYEAIYVDGKLVGHESTIYAHDIARAAGDSLIRFEQFATPDVPGDWPERLEDIDRGDQ